MQSRTSCFDRTVFLKTIRRYWPVWALWFAGWLLTMPLIILANARFEVTAVSLKDTILNLALYLGGIGGAAISLMSAMAVFSDLYNTRMAHGMACLPVRRETMYLSRMLAGIVPLLAVNVVIFAITLLAELSIGCVCLKETALWLAIVSMQLVLFYGMAVFCAQLTGSIVILPVVYVVMNFLVVGVAALIGAISEVYVVGAQFGLPDAAAVFSPLYAILYFCNVHGVSLPDAQGIYRTVDVRFEGVGLIAAYAVLGAVLLVLAAVLYRRRRTESAGDVVAVNVLKPAFRWCMGIGAGLSFGVLMSLVISHRVPLAMFAVFMLLGGFVGWFAAEMMNRKSYHVFRGRIWQGFGLCCAVLLIVCAAIRFDLTGYERYVPDPEKIDTAYVTTAGWDAQLTDPESCAALTAVHEAIVDRREEMRDPNHGKRTMYIRLNYELESGRSVRRVYYLPYEETEPQSLTELLALQDVMNRTDALYARKELAIPVTEETVSGAALTLYVTAEEAAKLAGFESGEEWLLTTYKDRPQSEFDAMSMLEREAWMEMILAEQGVLFHDEKSDGFVKEYTAATEYWTPTLESALFRYSYTLTPQEACDLYHNCVIPDMLAGTIGRVWLITDEEYERTVTHAQFEMDLREELTQQGNAELRDQISRYGYDAGQYRYDHFYITLTLSAGRTNAWLQARDLPLRSIAQSYNG